MMQYLWGLSRKGPIDVDDFTNSRLSVDKGTLVVRRMILKYHAISENLRHRYDPGCAYKKVTEDAP